MDSVFSDPRCAVRDPGKLQSALGRRHGPGALAPASSFLAISNFLHWLLKTPVLLSGLWTSPSQSPHPVPLLLENFHRRWSLLRRSGCRSSREWRRWQRAAARRGVLHGPQNQAPAPRTAPQPPPYPTANLPGVHPAHQVVLALPSLKSLPRRTVWKRTWKDPPPPPSLFLSARGPIARSRMGPAARTSPWHLFPAPSADAASRGHRHCSPQPPGGGSEGFFPSRLLPRSFPLPHTLHTFSKSKNSNPK